jgi:hypothetical protein
MSDPQPSDPAVSASGQTSADVEWRMAAQVEEFLGTKLRV